MKIRQLHIKGFKQQRIVTQFFEASRDEWVGIIVYKIQGYS